MKKMQLLIVIAALGAAIGTVLRPGLPEIFVATVAALCLLPLFRSRRSKAALPG